MNRAYQPPLGTLQAAQSEVDRRMWRNRAWRGRARQGLELGEPRRGGRGHHRFLAADRRWPRQDDQVVKTKLLAGSCLRFLDQGLGPPRARSSRNRPLESLCTWRSALKGGLDIPATHVGCNSLQREHPLRTFTRRACSRAGRVGNAEFASHRSLLCEDALPVVPQPIDQGPGHRTVPRWGWSAVVLKPQFRDRNERPGFPTAKRPDIERLQGRPC
jgi:hypothetical protein